MRVRSALIVLLLCVPAVAWVGSGSDHAGAAGSTAAAPTRAITVTGVLEHLVIDTDTGEDIRYAVRAADRTWWLDGLAEPAPAAGSLVEITGAPRDAYTLTVATIRVQAAESPSSAMVAATTPSSTRVLVLRAYWTASPPAAPTAATTRQKVLTDSQAWFKEVSHGRYTVSGTVTPWLKVSRPSDCYYGAFAVRDQAITGARRAGYSVASFGRIVVYMPCSPGSILGLGSMPGRDVWLFATLGKQVVMHEQGHNLGLPHASSRACRSGLWGSVTWSSDCQVVEYGDEIDAMGNRRPGHFGSYYKFRLGWLQSSTTATSTRTVTLAPYETTGPGIKAIRVNAGSATYWLEYRTRTGADGSMTAGSAGVQVRYQAAGGQTQLVDAAPGSTIGYYDFSDTHLPAGSSWTTPQNVRITVTGQTSTSATVAIRFGAGAPRPPSAPAPVQVQAKVTAARITWARPADNGAIIRRYTITRSTDGDFRTVTTTGGFTTSYTWDGLDPEQTYTFSVRAVSQGGTSPAATSPPVRPLTNRPSVEITSPADGATVQGVVPIEIDAQPSTATSPVQFAVLSVDGGYVTDDYAAPWGPLEWDTRGLPDGPHTIVVEVSDLEWDTASVTRTVTVDNPTPTVTITGPSDGDIVTGQVEVAYALAPADWPLWQSVSLLVDGSYWTGVAPGDPLSLDTTWLGAGSHTLQIEASSPLGSYRSPEVSVTVAEP
jgi:hypothetical protein